MLLYQAGRVGISLTGSAMEHVCSCSKPGSGFLMSYALVYFAVFSELMSAERGARVRIFNSLFSSISAISWRSMLLVEETGVPRENDRPVISYCETLSHNVVSNTPRHVWDSNS